jgi:Rps23 Pro-64 3,4-dihydroxylase Tpa1-like proline 4-hydroxylase
MDLVRDSDGSALAVRIGGLLPHGRLAALLEATLAEQRWFVDASTGGRDDHRRAQVLYTPVDVALEVVERVRHWAAIAARAFGRELDATARLECQITAYLHGGYYRRHTDDDGSEAAERAFTYVYYFHRLPRGFAGGELCLGERVLEPMVNELIVFPSLLAHEVRDVLVPSRAFADGRFSVNGWLWQA